MVALICFVLAVMASPFKSNSRLEVENAVLRHQLIILQRKVRGRACLTNNDRWFFVQMYRWFPSIMKVVTILEPETLVRWHRAGFRCYWRWKSRSPGGRPQIEIELRSLVEWLCRTVDRIDPARVLGPRYCFGRGTSAPDSKIIRRLLQLRQNASVIGQGCADFSSDSSDRNHSFTPDPRRASPSLRPGVSFRYTQRGTSARCHLLLYCHDHRRCQTAGSSAAGSAARAISGLLRCTCQRRQCRWIVGINNFGRHRFDEGGVAGFLNLDSRPLTGNSVRRAGSNSPPRSGPRSELRRGPGPESVHSFFVRFERFSPGSAGFRKVHFSGKAGIFAA